MANLAEQIKEGIAAAFTEIKDFLKPASTGSGAAPPSTERITALETQFRGLETKLTELASANATLETGLNQARNDLATARETIAAKEARITELETSARTVAQTSQDLVRAQGIPVTQAPEAKASAAGGDLLAQHAAITDPKELAAFEAKHYAELMTLARKGLKKAA